MSTPKVFAKSSAAAASYQLSPLLWAMAVMLNSWAKAAWSKEAATAKTLQRFMASHLAESLGIIVR